MRLSLFRNSRIHRFTLVSDILVVIEHEAAFEDVIRCDISKTIVLFCFLKPSFSLGKILFLIVYVSYRISCRSSIIRNLMALYFSEDLFGLGVLASFHLAVGLLEKELIDLVRAKPVFLNIVKYLLSVRVLTLCEQIQGMEILYLKDMDRLGILLEIRIHSRLITRNFPDYVFYYSLPLVMRLSD